MVSNRLTHACRKALTTAGRRRAAFALGALLAGCLRAQAPAAAPLAANLTSHPPARIVPEEISGGLGAVGNAEPNAMGDKDLQRQAAVADARKILACELAVRVRNLFSQLDQRVTAASMDTGNQVIRPGVMKRLIGNVTRQVLDQALEGTHTRGIWTNRSDGTLHVFVVMPKAALDHALASAARAQIKKEIAHGERNLDPALDNLDAAIAASANPAQRS